MSKAKETIRVTVNLVPELVQQLDGYACEMGINRTSAVSVLLKQALANNTAMADLHKLMTLNDKLNKSE